MPVDATTPIHPASWSFGPRQDGEVWTGASGSADLSGTELTSSASFRIGSITKPIVATLVLDAVARGELSLDDVVGDLLPGVIRAEPPVTVRMLLDHLSSANQRTCDPGQIAGSAPMN